MNLNNIEVNYYIVEKIGELFDQQDKIQLLWRVHTKDLVYVVANRNGFKEIYWFDGETDFASEFITVKTFKFGDGRDALNWLVGDLALNRIIHGDTCKVTEIYAYNDLLNPHNEVKSINEVLIFAENESLYPEISPNEINDILRIGGSLLD